MDRADQTIGWPVSLHLGLLVALVPQLVHAILVRLVEITAIELRKAIAEVAHQAAGRAEQLAPWCRPQS